MVKFVYKMRRFELLGIGLLMAAVLFSLIGVILNIILLVNQQTGASNAENCPPAPPKGQNKPANQSDGFKEASKLLRDGLDMSVDPCQDFYAFTCNGFARNNLLDPGQSTYDYGQWLVNEVIRKNLETMDEKDPKLSQTEKIVNKVYKICMQKAEEDHSKEINAELLVALFGGMPAVVGDGWKPKGGWREFWTALGQLEANYQVKHLLASMVTVDYSQHTRHALFLGQPEFILPREFYVKPQFLDHLDIYREAMIELVAEFSKRVNNGQEPYRQMIAEAVTDALAFEVQLAMAAYSSELRRNYRLQYNKYSIEELSKKYPSIGWAAYFTGLGLNVQDPTVLVLVSPRFFAFLDVVLQGEQWSEQTLVNLISMRVLMAFEQFLGQRGEAVRRLFDKIPHLKTYMSVAANRNSRRSEATATYEKEHGKEHQCIDQLIEQIPYGAGYVYMKNVPERNAVREDVKLQTELVIESFGEMLDSLDWIEPASKGQAHNKSDHLWQNYGWPQEMYGDFEDTSLLDKYHSHYVPLLTLEPANKFRAEIALRTAGQLTENLGLLSKEPTRSYFGGSPALVNAWYQPERNSITFPFAAFNPPYYRFDFPQAFNYGGQGGTGGHELSHGFDDEGVQFGPEGELSDCSWDNCGWMDSKSALAFTQMAQCVVQQYSLKCCPVKSGNVRCANGATTQGENIADLAGQQAAYNAYRKYITGQRAGQEEDSLPALEQFTPNQIFWITYGHSWCMHIDEAKLAKKLLTNEHAPGPCRVNQVVQDIPEFGRDFNCPIGSPMRPIPQDRCKVWTGI